MSDNILRLSGLRKRFGQTVAADDLSLDVERGAFFTFLGPSGSGKSTILRMIAGLERPDAGRIEIDGRDVSATPPWQRQLGMMFQQYALFPHMTVAANVGYGLKVRGAGGIAERIAEMLRLVGLAGMEERNATLLSGGEQQRVALARALAPKPKMLLLDEPLSALDEGIRRAMQTELKRVHSETGTTFLYVTHDQEEALTMSGRIAVLNRGHIAQCDAPETIYRRPRSVFVARFFRGCNVLTVTDPVSAEGVLACRLAGVALTGIPLGNRNAGNAHIAIRAEDVAIGSDAAESDFQLTGVLEDVTYRGTVLDYRLRLGDGQTLTAMMTRRMGLEPGATLTVGVNRENVIPLEH